MWSSTLLAVLVAVGAALLAWHHATQLDRRHSDLGPQESDDQQQAWPLTLGALIAAVAATALLQIAMLSSLVPR
jgi:hypothetical protein